MGDTNQNIDEYSLLKYRKILIAFDDMIIDIETKNSSQ